MFSFYGHGLIINLGSSVICFLAGCTQMTANVNMACMDFSYAVSTGTYWHCTGLCNVVTQNLSSRTTSERCHQYIMLFTQHVIMSYLKQVVSDLSFRLSRAKIMQPVNALTHLLEENALGAL